MVRQVRNAETILNIIRERGQRGLPITDAYRLLFQPDLYLREVPTSNSLVAYPTARPVLRGLPRREAATRLQGVLAPLTLLELTRYLTVFEKSRREDPKTGLTPVETVKKIAVYHQLF